MKPLFIRNAAAFITLLVCALWIVVFICGGWINESWLYYVNQLALGAALAALVFTTANRSTFEACLAAVPWAIAMVVTLIRALITPSGYIDTAELIVRAVLFSLMPFAAMAGVKLVMRFVSEEARQPWAILTAFGVKWLFALISSLCVFATFSFRLQLALTSGVGDTSLLQMISFVAVYVLCCRVSKTERE